MFSSEDLHIFPDDFSFSALTDIHLELLLGCDVCHMTI